MAVLEATLPRFFAGATELYNSGENCCMLLLCTSSAVRSEMFYWVSFEELSKVFCGAGGGQRCNQQQHLRPLNPKGHLLPGHVAL